MIFVPVIEQNGYIERKIIDLRLVVVVPKKMSSSWPGIDWSPILNDIKGPPSSYCSSSNTEPNSDRIVLRLYCNSDHARE